MNMHITDAQRHAMAIRNRLFNPPKRGIETAIVKIEPVIEPKPVRPLWATTDVHFDAHVVQWKALATDPHFLARQEIDHFLAETPSYRKPVKEIVAEVLKHHPGVTWADVIGKHRRHVVVEARHECMYAVHKQRKDMSYPLMGRLFGGRDHTTVLHAVWKMQAREDAQ